MPYSSHALRHEIFVAAAVIASHAGSLGRGFRQRDVKFLVEVFSNWVEATQEGEVLAVQNTQVQRYLDTLVREGYARKSKRGRAPLYQLTRTGLLELSSRIIEYKNFSSPGQFFFLFYFVSNYAGRMEELVKSEGTRFPYSLKLELEALFDAESLLKREVERTKRKLLRMDRRIADAGKTADLMQAGGRRGEALASLIETAEELYPYELNSQKSLSELMQGIHPGWRAWELETGNRQRIAQIWEPEREQLQSYLKLLEKLA